MWRESRKNGTALIRKGETRFHQASRAESKKPGFCDNLCLLTRLSEETRFLTPRNSRNRVSAIIYQKELVESLSL